ncbi:MAG: DUF2298 domain-containing protein [Candidatus Roizmanbacteria bacterium]|nr:DUF2298 domain-containing protein [Candidatus Roizmanbacteria bacterium]
MIGNFFAWLPQIALWYGAYTAVGLSVLPITSYLFRKFDDKGYPFAKTLGVSILSYIVFLLARYAHLSFSLTTITLCLTSIALINWSIFVYQKSTIKLPSLKTIILYEIVFFIALAFWSYVRGNEPSLRSLEKFMDLGFIYSAFRSTSLPPQDMWYAQTTNHGAFFVNYYYFGHYITALVSKLTGIVPNISFNLMLATVFALSITSSFSLGYHVYSFFFTKTKKYIAIYTGILTTFFLNFGGNLHTIYLFTKGYPPGTPIPFWKILSHYNPIAYWYPNATRYIPFTIHEFPTYSHVVADLHGHVLNIPIVLLIIGLFIAFIYTPHKRFRIIVEIFFAYLLSIAYMTNATDLLVYGGFLFFLYAVGYKNIGTVLMHFIPTIGFAVLLTYPFSSVFNSFVSAIGINCAPQWLIHMGKLGIFLGEADKCQSSPFWMLFILWGFFWFIFAGFLTLIFTRKKILVSEDTSYFIFFIFTYSLLLTLTAEFIYFKDIYPAHFRANTMFKLGYQAYIMMTIFGIPLMVRFIRYTKEKISTFTLLYASLLIICALFVSVYGYFAIHSFYGDLKHFTTLDGSSWIQKDYPQMKGVIDFLKKNDAKEKLPYSILEANGDSYTDYNMVSANTGIPTIVGWGVHEWLWRGDYSSIVAPRAAEVLEVYTNPTSEKTKQILHKYTVRYILISQFEREKFPSLNVKKFYTIGRIAYHNGETYLFKVNR